MFLCVASASLLGCQPSVGTDCQIDEMVDAATIVIQVAETEVTRTDIGACALTGRVARSFRGPIERGNTISTWFPCTDPAVINRPPVANKIWDPAEVAAATAVEIHSEGSGCGPAAYGEGMVLLDALTDSIARRPLCR